VRGAQSRSGDGGPEERRVTVCAGCGRRAVNDTWEKHEGEVAAMAAGVHFTHSVCPTCFAAMAPGIPYPKRQKPAP
jgi:hypothetical protein